ncbi:uncharacterized protein LOC123566503 [Mercenaria mercenaria]|uniref:uncharacterized protein LOC123566503 n=1 Tax=Mercenaria mercenaria TaxID=6596 RepID=UPI00234F4FA7|nr:uncharacterized protein LOC123566503 [Mercenaria mercenaria]
MELRHIFVILIYVFEMCLTVAATNDTNSTQEETTTTGRKYSEDTDEDKKLFGNPFWLGFTVILFISLVILSVFISLTYGIYKYRQNARRQGLYKDRRRIYIEGEENQGPDYDMFTTDRTSESTGVSNATYIGST